MRSNFKQTNIEQFIDAHRSIVQTRYSDMPLVTKDKQYRLEKFLSKDNPFFVHGEVIPLVAFAGQHPEGCALLILDPNTLGAFAHAGFIEFLGDATGAELLQCAFRVFEERGYPHVRAPVDGSIWQSYRLGLSCKEDTFRGEPYHHSSYEQVFRKVGFSVIQKNVSKEIALSELPEGRFEKSIQALSDLEMTVTRVQQEEIYQYADEIFRLLPEGFPDAQAISPIAKSEFLYWSRDGVVSDKVDVFIAQKSGAVVGFLYGYADPHHLEGGRYVIKAVVVAPEFRGCGLGTALLSFAEHEAVRLGLRHLMYALMRVDNLPILSIAGKEKSLYREYAFYEYHGAHLSHT